MHDIPALAATPVQFHLDYLTLTVFTTTGESASGSAATIKQILEERIWNRYSHRPLEWRNIGPARLWSCIDQGPPGVSVRTPKDDASQWTSVEFKGEAFTWLTSEDVLQFTAELSTEKAFGSIDRWHASRIDFAFDHVALSPRWLLKNIENGSLRTKAGKLDHQLFVNAQGETTYLGKKALRQVRLYDRRGFNRFELELHDIYARQAFATLEKLPIVTWPAAAIGYIRSLCDFVNPASASRLSRCELLPEWEEFVGTTAIQRIERRGPATSNTTPAGSFNFRLKRASTLLAQVRHALGRDDYLRLIDTIALKATLNGAQTAEADDLKEWTHFLDGMEQNEWWKDIPV